MVLLFFDIKNRLGIWMVDGRWGVSEVRDCCVLGRRGRERERERERFAYFHDIFGYVVDAFWCKTFIEFMLLLDVLCCT